MNLTFILIPGWLVKALKAANLPLTAALEVDKLNSILSKDDVSFYCYSNSILLSQMYPALARDLPLHFVDYSQDPSIVKKVQDFAATATPVHDANAYDTVIPVPSQEVEENPTKRDIHLFTFQEIRDNVVAILPVKAVGEHISEVAVLKDCYSNAIAFLHSYLPLEGIATTSIFREYVNLSRKHGRSE